MSWNAPAPILISRTPPSKVDSSVQLFRKVTCGEVKLTKIGGVTRTLSVTTAASLVFAWFGGVSLPPDTVTQASAAVPVITIELHPAGTAGGVTPSKFSEIPHG